MLLKRLPLRSVMKTHWKERWGHDAEPTPIARKQQQTFLRMHEATQRRRRATHPRRRKQHTSSNAQRASRRMWEQQGAAWHQVFPALARANCSFVDESALWKQGGKCKRRELGRRVRGASNIHIFSKLPLFSFSCGALSCHLVVQDGNVNLTNVGVQL